MILMRITKYSQCLEDIEAALSNSIHLEAEYVLLDRKAKCQMELNQDTEARLTFGKALMAVESADVADKVREVFKMQVNNQLDVLTKKSTEFTVGTDSFFKLKATSKQFDGLTAKAKVEYCGEVLGRRLVATEDISPG